MKIISTFLLCVLLCNLDASAQEKRPIPYPVFPTPQFEKALENGTRSSNGDPGDNYWTNHAKYEIHAEVNPSKNTLLGDVSIDYKNNSPNSIQQIFLLLRQNVYQEGVPRTRFAEVTGGMTISLVELDGERMHLRNRSNEVGYLVQGTQMIINGDTALASGETRKLRIVWSQKIPEKSFRNGQDGEVYFLAYWYPQVAVYDDLRGWDPDPYMGAGEHYMGYADYDVNITVPEAWLVASTGVLNNAESVLSEQTRTRLAEATSQDSVIHVVASDDMSAGKSTLDSESGLLTWNFKAENVRDFVFGTSDKYLWDATRANLGSGNFSAINAFYREDRNSWDRSAEFARFSIEHLSEMLLPYPWPHMTTVEGIVGGGMEYPMMTLIGRARSPRSLFSVTYHEISHMWFPMIVGSDEKAYTWMDEGLTSFNTAEGNGEFWDDDTVHDPERQSYFRIAGTGREVPPMRHGDRYPQNSPARGIASYNKPQVGLNALRGIFGEEKFKKAYSDYAKAWAFKHPSPYDFFNKMENGLGEDLDWFWTEWLFQDWTLDQAIQNVTSDESGVAVSIEDLGLSVFPTPVKVSYADGKTEEKAIPVSTWLNGTRKAELLFPAGQVTKVEIDPDMYLPDVNRANNSWEAN